MPIKRRGLTSFTWTRYLCPQQCGYEGKSVFFDADMLCLGDVFELADLIPKDCSVAVVKNPLRFEWPSMMVFNNANCKALTPEFIETGNPQELQWGEVGELPKEWNFCVGYDELIPKPKLVHYTQGIPCFEETKDCSFADEWRAELKHMTSTVSWSQIMGSSVHAEPVLRRLGRL